MNAQVDSMVVNIAYAAPISFLVGQTITYIFKLFKVDFCNASISALYTLIGSGTMSTTSATPIVAENIILVEAGGSGVTFQTNDGLLLTARRTELADHRCLRCTSRRSAASSRHKSLVSSQCWSFSLRKDPKVRTPTWERLFVRLTRVHPERSVFLSRTGPLDEDFKLPNGWELIDRDETGHSTTKQVGGLEGVRACSRMSARPGFL